MPKYWEPSRRVSVHGQTETALKKFIGNENLLTVNSGTAGLTLAGSPGTITDVEHYNGTAWSEQSAAFPGQRSIFGISGAQTNALIFGGEPPSSGTATAFVYDGTSFATSPSMGTARSSMGSPGPAGTSTSAIAITRESSFDSA